MKPRACRSRNWILLAAVTVVMASMWLVGGVANAQTQGGKPVYVPDEYIIHVTPGTSVPQVQQMVDKLGATLTDVLPLSDHYLIKLGRSGGNRSASDKHLSNTPTAWTIDYIQPNYYKYLQAIPDDAYWDKLWGMRMINAPAAWEVEKGNSSVIVAVNDTGVAKHPDLVDRLLTGQSFVDGDTDPNNDRVGHGTHVAGTIAAQGNNGIGVCGVNWNGTKILPVRIFDANEETTTAAVVNGLDYAMAQHADVVNMSYGSYAQDPAEHSKIAELSDAGIILVAAAGNDSLPMVGYPAGYSEVISVASIGPYEATAFYSNYGKVDIAAPGGDSTFGDDGQIWSTTVSWSTATPPVATFSYGPMQGTSMASPHVAGAAALLISHGVAASDVRGRLLSSARPPKTGAMDSTKYGAGILDLRAAIAAASIRIVKPEKGSTVRSTPDFKITIMGIDTSTVKVYLDYPDVDDNGIPDSLTDSTYVVVDGTNVSYYLNTTRTAIAFSWPLPGKSPLTSGTLADHRVYVTAKSSVDGSTVSDWGTFKVTSRQISAGIHMVSFPYQFATTALDGSVTMSALPSNLLLDLGGRPLSFSAYGSNRNVMMRWIPKTSVVRSVPYFTYNDDKAVGLKTFSEKLAWDNPHDLTWYTGGGYFAGTPTQYTFPAGTGYWLFLGQDSMINESYQPLATTDAFKVYLYSGWNMIGNPFGHDVSWGSVLFTYRGEGPKSLLEAEAAGWVKSTLYGWNSTSGRYDPVSSRDMLEAYNGYWLRASVGGTSASDSLILTILP